MKKKKLKRYFENMQGKALKLRRRDERITTPISLNRFNFKGKLMLNKCLKTLKSGKDIRFHNKWIIPYMFGMRINKNNKIVEAIRRKHRSRTPNIIKY